MEAPFKDGALTGDAPPTKASTAGIGDGAAGSGGVSGGIDEPAVLGTYTIPTGSGNGLNEIGLDEDAAIMQVVELTPPHTPTPTRKHTTGDDLTDTSPRKNPREESKSLKYNVDWLPDAEVYDCTKCAAPFSLFRRRHHCRRCGRIFCADCCFTKQVVGGSTNKKRVCDLCVLAVAEAAEEAVQILAAKAQAKAAHEAAKSMLAPSEAHLRSIYGPDGPALRTFAVDLHGFYGIKVWEDWSAAVTPTNQWTSSRTTPNFAANGFFLEPVAASARDMLGSIGGMGGMGGMVAWVGVARESMRRRICVSSASPWKR